MKKTLICSVALAFLCTTGLAALSMAQDKGPAEIILGGKGFKPALFPHADHQARLQCGVCHHSKGPDGKQVPYTKGMKIQKCETCHNKNDGMPKGLTSLKDVAHKKCKGCHRETDRKLTMCSTCHKKGLKK